MRVSPELFFIGALSDWQNRVSMPSFAHETEILLAVRAGADHQCLLFTFLANRSWSCGEGGIGRPSSPHWIAAGSCRRLVRSRLDAAGDGALAREESYRRASQRMEAARNTGNREKLGTCASDHSTSRGFSGSGVQSERAILVRIRRRPGCHLPV